MSKAAESSTLTWVVEMASLGRQFMDIMEDYMERQQDDDFDVSIELEDLYTNLSNLYFNYE
tara:strand:- start:188 stop:370 length:183 start_codon:yes stop_codon:yes gene_type:complete